MKYKYCYYECKICFHAGDYHDFKKNPAPCLIFECNCKKCILRPKRSNYRNEELYSIGRYDKRRI